ncbi:MAG: hypothetical protein QXL16_00150 [Candidatus Micrarchaeaceae archaeon]
MKWGLTHVGLFSSLLILGGALITIGSYLLFSYLPSHSFAQMLNVFGFAFGIIITFLGILGTGFENRKFAIGIVAFILSLASFSIYNLVNVSTFGFSTMLKLASSSIPFQYFSEIFPISFGGLVIGPIVSIIASAIAIMYSNYGNRFAKAKKKHGVFVNGGALISFIGFIVELAVLSSLIYAYFGRKPVELAALYSLFGVIILAFSLFINVKSSYNKLNVSKSYAFLGLLLGFSQVVVYVILPTVQLSRFASVVSSSLSQLPGYEIAIILGIDASIMVALGIYLYFSGLILSIFSNYRRKSLAFMPLLFLTFIYAVILFA